MVLFDTSIGLILYRMLVRPGTTSGSAKRVIVTTMYNCTYSMTYLQASAITGSATCRMINSKTCSGASWSTSFPERWYWCCSNNGAAGFAAVLPLRALLTVLSPEVTKVVVKPSDFQESFRATPLLNALTFAYTTRTATPTRTPS
nr:hypothetical protein CFP56_01060 [Quercus suber]